ncbi:hypothetical protein V2J09_005205 [Rumex salicifolius]
MGLVRRPEEFQQLFATSELAGEEMKRNLQAKKNQLLRSSPATCENAITILPRHLAGLSLAKEKGRQINLKHLFCYKSKKTYTTPPKKKTIQMGRVWAFTQASIIKPTLEIQVLGVGGNRNCLKKGGRGGSILKTNGGKKGKMEAEIEDMARDENDEQMDLLRDRFRLSAISIAQSQAKNCEMDVSDSVIACISDLTFKYSEQLAKDFELFAQHGGRKTVNMEDVILSAHRNEHLSATLRSISNDLKAREPQSDKKRKKASIRKEDRGTPSSTQPAFISGGEKKLLLEMVGWSWTREGWMGIGKGRDDWGGEEGDI